MSTTTCPTCNGTGWLPYDVAEPVEGPAWHFVRMCPTCEQFAGTTEYKWQYAPDEESTGDT